MVLKKGIIINENFQVRRHKRDVGQFSVQSARHVCFRGAGRCGRVLFRHARARNGFLNTEIAASRNNVRRLNNGLNVEIARSSFWKTLIHFNFRRSLR